MKPKQIAILLGILAACLVVVLAVRSKKASSYTEPALNVGEKVFPEFPVNDITRAQFMDDGKVVTVEKNDDAWTVAEREGYPADFDKISSLIQRVWEVEITEAQKVSKAGIARLHLEEPTADEEPPADDADDADDPTGALFTFEKGGDEVAKFVVGEAVTAGTTVGSGSSFNAAGVFLKPDGSGSDVYKVSTTFDEFLPRPQDWLDKSWIKTSKITRLKLTAPEESESFELVRDDPLGKFAFANPKEGEELDEAKTGPLKNSFANTAFKDVLVGGEAEEDLFEGGHVFEIDTADGFSYTVKVGTKMEEEGVYPVALEVSAEIETEYVPEPAPDEEAVEDAPDAELSDEQKAAKEKEVADKKAAAEAAAKAKQEAFEKNVADLQRKLEEEEFYEGHIYLVNSWSLDPLLKKRSDLIKVEEEGAVEGDEDNTGGVRPPISAVTPPIEVPMPARTAEPSEAPQEAPSE